MDENIDDNPFVSMLIQQNEQSVNMKIENLSENDQDFTCK